MTPETQAILITLGALVGFGAKRIPWVNNQAIPFIVLAFQYLGAVLNGGGFLPVDPVMGGVAFTTVGWGWATQLVSPFWVAIQNTAINVFLHQFQKAVRHLPIPAYVTADQKKTKK